MSSEKSSYSVSETDDRMEITFSGRMETVFITEQMDQLLAIINDYPNDVILNLAQVNYISSSFLRLCVSAAKTKAKANEKLTVINLQPEVKKVLKIAGLDTILC